MAESSSGISLFDTAIAKLGRKTNVRKDAIQCYNIIVHCHIIGFGASCGCGGGSKPADAACSAQSYSKAVYYFPRWKRRFPDNSGGRKRCC